MILYMASDLMWATRLKSTAEQLGFGARPVRSIEMLEARLSEGLPAGLIVDLEKPELAVELIRRLREEPEAGEIPVIAFGPHVAADALRSARQAGATEALPRGLFTQRLPEILTVMGAPGAEAT